MKSRPSCYFVKVNYKLILLYKVLINMISNTNKHLNPDDYNKIVTPFNEFD